MESISETPPTVQPPRLIPTFVAGFNAVANHVGLILIPLGLDLLLWLAPRINLKNLLEPQIADTLSYMKEVGSAEMLQTTMEMWKVLLERFNLLSILRTLPVGVPSLMASTLPEESPLGKPLLYQINTLGQAASLWLLLGLLGLLLTSLYFSLMARASSQTPETFALHNVLDGALRCLWLTLLTLLLIMIISFPLTLMMMVLAAINPALAEIAMFMVGLMLIWMMLPLVFTPHGIFSYHLPLLKSLLASIRLVRFFLPGTGLFLLVGILLWQGLDVLWRIPPDNSWMMLVGIFGHAFITTAVLTASFIYYRGGMQWMQYNLEKMNVTAASA